MGIIAKQATSNAIFTLGGTIFGAINTILVLPLAFAEFKSGWGALRFILSWAVIFSQLFSMGSFSVVLNFLPKIETVSGRSALMKFLLTLTCGSTVLLIVLLLLFKAFFLNSVSGSDLNLFQEHYSELIVLSAALIFTALFGAYSVANYQSRLFTFFNDPFLKIVYLAFALLYLFSFISFDALIWLFVGGYVLVTSIMFMRSRHIGMRFEGSLDRTTRKATIEYGFYSILDRGSQVVTQNLDIIMIGMLMQLSNVAEYVIAFFIGGVVLIPMRSINSISNPIISKAIEDDNIKEMVEINKKTALYSTLLGGFIFACVQVNVDDIFSLLPEKFSGGELVVLFIGLSKLFAAMAGSSRPLIVFSKYFRADLTFNIALIVLTIATNLIFIPIYGITGAAGATAMSALIVSIARMVYVQSKFGINPVSRSLIITLIVLALSTLVVGLIPLSSTSIVNILIRCVACALLFLPAVHFMNVIPELKEVFLRKNNNPSS